MKVYKDFYLDISADEVDIKSWTQLIMRLGAERIFFLRKSNDKLKDYFENVGVLTFVAYELPSCEGYLCTGGVTLEKYTHLHLVSQNENSAVNSDAAFDKAMSELSFWCLKNRTVLETGRHHGFLLVMNAQTKQRVIDAFPDVETGKEVMSNVYTIERDKVISLT
jgi:hypothetical protein